MKLIFIVMKIEKQSATVFTPLADGKAVLLNLDTLFYYSLNRTGTAVWQRIESEGVVALDDLVRDTCEQFDVNEEGARKDITAFIERLQQFKMVRVNYQS